MFLSGQIPVDPNTEKIEETDIISQTKQVLSNIGAVLDESGSTFLKIIKTTVFLVNMDDFSKFNEIYAIILMIQLHQLDPLYKLLLYRLIH